MHVTATITGVPDGGQMALKIVSSAVIVMLAAMNLNINSLSLPQGADGQNRLSESPSHTSAANSTRGFSETSVRLNRI